ncbi:MAG: glycosyltransferase family 4 protein [Candidatus Berkelbacteria bacterium]|nr:glycosyltransferase family 4 protein [Candidatus Berkelbacteria bacterium]MCR4307242.1 glycosyltransferase family 4 protein [Candidatus Berkelbacteria bacterium]
MTIGIDASRAVKKIRTGPENYSYEIIRAILNLKSDHKFILYAPHSPYNEFPTGENIEWKILPQQRLWSQYRLAKEVNSNPPDVLFVPSHVVPLMSHLPTVVTIHDLAFKYFPQSYSAFERRYQNFSTGVSVAKSNRIIVPSQATLTDLVKFYPTAKSKTSVIAHGYDKDLFKPADSHEASPQNYPYILYVGRIEEKKNVRLLLDAFVLISKEKKRVNLVLGGRNGYGFEMIQEKIKNLPKEIRSRIFQPGHLPRYDMIRYLQHATILAFPSLYEGFGLSVLEALACGLPVVCSDNSSLPEVTGDAAILLPPSNPLAWASAFSRILNTPELATKMRQAAIKQAENFSWQTAAEKTLLEITHAANK